MIRLVNIYRNWAVKDMEILCLVLFKFLPVQFRCTWVFAPILYRLFGVKVKSPEDQKLLKYTTRKSSSVSNILALVVEPGTLEL